MELRLEHIWVDFAGKLKSFIISKVRSEQIAEDILQDVFIKIHGSIDQLRDETKVQSWIYQITRNSIVDYFRIVKKENNLSQHNFENEDEELDDGFMTEAIRDMIKMMDDLPPKYCEALCLTELDGMSQKAYTEKIGISYSRAKSRVQRAKVMLRDNLMKCCHYQFDKYGTMFNIQPVKCCCCHPN